MTDSTPGNAAQGTFEVRVWDFGQPQVLAAKDRGATVDIVCPNGDLAQLLVTADGEIVCRAWKSADRYENGGENRSVFSASGHFNG